MDKAIVEIRDTVRSILDTCDITKQEMMDSYTGEPETFWGYYVYGRSWESIEPSEEWLQTFCFDMKGYAFQPVWYGERVDLYVMGGSGLHPRLMYTKYLGDEGFSVDSYYTLVEQDMGTYVQPTDGPLFRFAQLFVEGKVFAEGRLWLDPETSEQLRWDLRVQSGYEASYADLRRLLLTDWRTYIKELPCVPITR